MNLFVVLIIISFAGIGAALWLMRSADDPEADVSSPEKAESFLKKVGFKKDDTDKPSPQAVENKDRLSFLKKLKLGRKSSFDEEVPEATPIEDLKEIFNRPATNAEPTQEEPAPTEPSDDLLKGAQLIDDPTETEEDDLPADEPLSLTPDPVVSTETTPLTLSDNEEKKIEAEVEKTVVLDELKEKYTKLEKMLQEKSQALEKTAHTLESEQRNRKDFNKVKDLLEKELKDVKDRARQSQLELTNANQEIENQKKRFTQLEEKVSHLQKDLLVKEDELQIKDKQISELNEKIATLAQNEKEQTQTSEVDSEKKAESAPPDTNTTGETPETEASAEPISPHPSEVSPVESKPEISTQSDTPPSSENLEKQDISVKESDTAPNDLPPAQGEKESIATTAAEPEAEPKVIQDAPPPQEQPAPEEETLNPTADEVSIEKNEEPISAEKSEKLPEKEPPAANAISEPKESLENDSSILAIAEEPPTASSEPENSTHELPTTTAEESIIDSSKNSGNILDIINEEEEVALEVANTAPEAMPVPDAYEILSEDELLIDDSEDTETEFLTLQPDILNDDTDFTEIDLSKETDDKKKKNNPDQETK